MSETPDFSFAAKLIVAQQLLHELTCDTNLFYEIERDYLREKGIDGPPTERHHSNRYEPNLRNLHRTREMFTEALAAVLELVPPESIRRDTTIPPEGEEPEEIVAKAQYVLEFVEAAILDLSQATANV